MGQGGLAEIPNNSLPAKIGSVAAVASGGAGALLADTFWVAPANLAILSAWKTLNANDVTAGTSISSTSYRRYTLVNIGSSGTKTTIMASHNATASAAASGVPRAFTTTASNTMAAGEMMAVSHLTVGAATADGTDMSAGNFEVAYQLL